MKDRLFQQVRILDLRANIDRVGDILMSDRGIQEVMTVDRASEISIEDGSHLVFAPGLVDLYGHSGEPGYEERDTLASLLNAAKAGGFVRLNILPDTQPPLDRVENILSLHARYREMTNIIPNCPELGIWAALTQNLAGEAMTELVELSASQICGWADGKSIASHQFHRRLLEYLQPYQQPIALYACDLDLRGKGMARAGVDALRLGLTPDPVSSETSALAHLLETIADVGTPVHLMRISTARGVELIAAAKQRGIPVTASTTWLHLVADTSDLNTYNPNFHLDPPLGTPSDRAALIAGIKDGTLDAIAIEHTPHTYEDKTVAFGESPVGAIGLELALPLLWANLVTTEKLTAIELWQSLSHNPARCLGQTPPDRSILFDTTHTWHVSSATLHSRSHNTAWLGAEITGKVLNVVDT
jgi:dihydroorotase